MITDISKIIPLQSIEDNFMVTGNGDLTFGFKLMLPEIYTLTPEKANNIQNSLVQIFSRLEAGSCIQKLDFFYQDKIDISKHYADNYTKKNYLRHISTRKIMKHDSYLFVTIRNNPVQAKYNDTSLLKNVDYIFNKPFKELDKVIQKAEAAALMVSNSLSTITEIVSQRLDDNHLLDVFYSFFSMRYNTTEKNEYNLEPIDDTNGLKIGNQYVDVYSLITEGNYLDALKYSKILNPKLLGSEVQLKSDIKVKTSLTYPIGLGLAIDHVLSLTIEVDEVNNITPKLDTLGKKLGFPAALGFRQAQSRKEAIDIFLDTIAKHSYTPCKVSLQMFVNNEDINVLKSQKSFIETAFLDMNGTKVIRENYDALNVFITSSPGYAYANYRLNLTVSTIQHAISYFHKETTYLSDRNGYLFIDRLGDLVVIDLWDKELKYVQNRGKLVAGPSGSGKSVGINYIINQSYYLGNHLVMMDIGRSYEKAVLEKGGLFFDSANRDLLSFNIFDCPIDENGKYLYNSTDADGEGVDDKVDFIYAIIIYIWKGGEKPTQEVKSILKDMIRKFYEYINEFKIFPKLIEFYNFIDYYKENKFVEARKKYFDFEALKITLEDYCQGDKAKLLNSDQNIDLLNTRIINFELKSLLKADKDMFNLVCIILVELITQKINKLPEDVRKSLWFDESLDFLKSDIADFIAYIFRVFRKHNGEIALAMQDINFLDDLPLTLKKSITTNCDYKIILNHIGHEDLFPDLQRILSLTEEQMDLIKSLSKGEVFIMMGTRHGVYKIDESQENMALFMTNADENAVVKSLFKDYGDMETAINEYVSRKQKLALKN